MTQEDIYKEQAKKIIAVGRCPWTIMGGNAPDYVNCSDCVLFNTRAYDTILSGCHDTSTSTELVNLAQKYLDSLYPQPTETNFAINANGHSELLKKWLITNFPTLNYDFLACQGRIFHYYVKGNILHYDNAHGLPVVQITDIQKP